MFRPSRQLLVFLPWCAAILGCGGSQATPPPSPRTPEVQVSLPVTKEVTEYEEFPGQTMGEQTIEVRARVSGYLAKFLFKEGAEVKKGDLLFEIDQRPYRAELAQAEANLRQAEARADRLTEDLRRDQKLSRGVVSQADLDKTIGDHKEAVAAVGSAQAARDRAKLNLEFTEVRAPISGRISRRLIDPWNMVKADETPLTTIVSLDPIYAFFDVDEGTVLRLGHLIRDGKMPEPGETSMPIYLGLADEEGYPHQGTIDFVDNQVDSNTGTLRVRGVFANPKRILGAGLFVRLRLPLGTPHEALLVAEQALGRDQGQKYVYVVDSQNKVVYRRIKVGRLYYGLREVTGGLAPDERVIVNGLQRVRPDVNVEAKIIDMPQTQLSEARSQESGVKDQKSDASQPGAGNGRK